MSWINAIADQISSAFNAVRPALKAIPSLMLLCEIKNRPGLSAIALTAAIIQRFPEAGIETGVNPDGSPNVISKYTRILCEEWIKEIKDNMKITCVVEPGSIVSQGTGSNAGGPVTVFSTNTMVASASGIAE